VTNQTSRLHAGRPDYAILVTAVALVVIGLIFVYSASFAVGLETFNNANYFIVRQVAAAVLGLVLMLGFMRFDYHRLRTISPMFMLFAVVSLFVVLVVGADAYGARRWIPLGPLPPFQPSEFAKLAIIIYISAWLASRGKTVGSFALGFVPFTLSVGLVSGLVLIEPDTGTAFVIILTTAALFFLAGANVGHLGAMAGIVAVIGVMLVLGGGHRGDRVFAFLSAEEDPLGLGFQIRQLLIALGSGGVEGLGLGVSRQKFGYIPAAHTDGIFAIVGEETGFIGSMVVVVLFAYLVYRGFRVALNARDEFGFFLAMGVTCWIGFQTLINIGGISRSIPMTGIPMPLVSYGGSSLIMLLSAIGVLLNVSRYSKGQAYIERPERRRQTVRNNGVKRVPQRQQQQTGEAGT
jgi:cell division protein FtsW